MSEFHLTRMGQRFYESTMPDLVDQLARLNVNLERLLAVAEAGVEPAPETTAGTEPEEPR